MKPNTPEDVFRAEKERSLTVRNSQHARLLAEAKAAFDKLMAEGQAARKSGRPRKHPLPPLKTSSSVRAPIKPPPAPATPALVAKLAPPKPAAPAHVSKPTVKSATKNTPAKGAAKKARAAKSVKRAAPKSKSKSKRPTRR